MEEAVAQTDAAEGELQSATSGDTQQRGSTPEGLYDAEDGADSVSAKSGRRTRSQAGQRLPAGQQLGPFSLSQYVPSRVCVQDVFRLGGSGWFVDDKLLVINSNQRCH